MKRSKGSKILLGVFSVIIMGFYIGTFVLGNDPLQPSIASKILRFHVLANSDASCDQAVKEEVRDAVGIYLQPYLEDADSLAETKEIVGNHLGEIIAVSKETLRSHGYDYDVVAKITDVVFPEKSYGSYTFPKGEYEALQIVIGEGKGQNWWCVLYPNMCFKGAVFEVIEEEAETALREVLSPWEYASVFEADHIEFHFKFLEYFGERR